VRTTAILVAALAFSLCGAAQGSFPGANGHIAYMRAGGAGSEPLLVAVDLATGSEQALGPGSDPAYSPDGAKLAFVRDGTIHVAAADGSGAIAVGAGDEPAWSPDGDHLVVSRPIGGVRQLVVLGLDDASSVQLTDLIVDATLPAWSPDGATIAFATPATIATVPAAGGAPVPLGLPGVGGPSWSPDGRSLAFMDAGGEVWTAAADGSGARQLTYALVTSSGSTVRPAWSPDGASIAFTNGADLCVTDHSGVVRRVTRSQQGAATVVGSLPDWQPAGSGSGTIFAAPPGPNDTIGCDWNPGARVELLEANVAPSLVTVPAPQQVVFVNHLTRPLTVTTTLRGEHGTIAPGRYAGFATVPGTYEFTVSGYPDGVPRRGTLVATSTGHVTAEAHAPLRYGSRTEITGAAGPAGGTVTIGARPFGASRVRTIATVKPSGGRWRLTVAPKITTTYEVEYGGATAERRLRVMPSLRATRKGGTVTVSLKPTVVRTRRPVYVFRLRGAGWDQFRSARVGRSGTAVFAKLPKGRYYVAFAGGDAYWSTATEPFTVRR
jgi:dipeptidyl aminopeptidase/acylaminoacyl peptidase